MNFLLDENLPPNWSSVLVEASRRQFPDAMLGEVCHIRDRFGVSAQDTVWLDALGAEKNWAVLSGDAFRKRQGAERRLIRKHGITVFVLQPSWSSRRYWDKLSQLVLWWPKIVAQANAVEASTFEVPWRSSGRFRQI